MAPCFLLHLKFFTLLLLMGHHGCFSSPVPRPSGFSSLFPSWRGTMASFLLLCPASSGFSSLFSSRRGTMAAFLLLCPAPWIFLLSLSYDQNPVTSLDLISGHTIGLPKGCHRHIIPLSNIPQAVTLPYYINSQ